MNQCLTSKIAIVVATFEVIKLHVYLNFSWHCIRFFCFTLWFLAYRKIIKKLKIKRIFPFLQKKLTL